MESMEELLMEVGPKNPLLFLSLSLVNRIPGYKPDENGILNQLDCMNDLLTSVSASVFGLEPVKNVVAVACDSLMTISGSEAKKSIEIRVAALECLLLLMDKLASCGINSLIEIIPGILSRMIKLSTSRIDVEIDRIIILSLKVIRLIVKTFWTEQNDWNVSVISDKDKHKCELVEDNGEKIVLLKKKYRDNVDMIICALKPLIRCNERISTFKPILLDIFNSHLNSEFNKNNSSISTLKLFLLLISDKDKVLASGYEESSVYNLNSSHNRQQILKIYNEEIVEWFQNSDLDTKQSIHEEVLKEKLQLIFGLLNYEEENKNKSTIVMICDIFTIIKQLTTLKVSIGDTVSIEYSCASDIGITEAFSQTSPNQITSVSVPVIEFKHSLKYSAEFFKLTSKLFKRIIEIDYNLILHELMTNFNDDLFELVMQKIDLSSSYYSSLSRSEVKVNERNNLELLEDCLKYYQRVSMDLEIEKSQMIHLATLKLLWSFANLNLGNANEKDEDIKSNNFNYIRPHLLIILSGMASKWILLREAATQILKAIAVIYEKKSVGHLVQENQRFILDRLGTQLVLPSFFPEAPQIISCLVRDIVDPPTALKFTDLLVRKVNDNLALYQRHSAYCRDLLTVAQESIETISKIQAFPFIDPKSFAFQKEDEESSDKNIENLSCQQRIILDLLKVGINFILSDSKLIRSKSIDLITSSVSCFIEDSKIKIEPSSLCQVIHIAWPNMMAVLKDSAVKDEKGLNQSLQSDLLVVESFLKCTNMLFKKLPIFMRDRFVKDYWRGCLRKNFNLFNPTFNHFSRAALKIVNFLLETLQIGISNCKPSTEVCLEIVEKISVILDDRSNNNNFIVKLFESISIIEPDVIWYFFNVQLGMISEISPNQKQNNNNHTNYPLKSFSASELAAAAHLKGNIGVNFSFYKSLFNI